MLPKFLIPCKYQYDLLENLLKSLKIYAQCKNVKRITFYPHNNQPRTWLMIVSALRSICQNNLSTCVCLVLDDGPRSLLNSTQIPQKSPPETRNTWLPVPPKKDFPWRTWQTPAVIVVENVKAFRTVLCHSAVIFFVCVCVRSRTPVCKESHRLLLQRRSPKNVRYAGMAGGCVSVN